MKLKPKSWDLLNDRMFKYAIYVLFIYQIFMNSSVCWTEVLQDGLDVKPFCMSARHLIVCDFIL